MKIYTVYMRCAFENKMVFGVLEAGGAETFSYIGCFLVFEGTRNS